MKPAIVLGTSTMDLGVIRALDMIRFGSQVDLFLPVRKVSQPEVKIGQRLQAGTTFIARYNPAPDTASAALNKCWRNAK